MNALPLPVALADVLARGDVWRGDALPGLLKPQFRANIPNLTLNCWGLVG
ncbi:MAG TPA: hypothetical protein VK165_09090 [Azonexus sp.]|nr:hypothetical protein [Azonexus sp.]